MNEPADSLLVTSKYQRDDASGGLGDIAGRRIGRRAVLGGLAPDDAAHRLRVEVPSGIESEPCASHGQHNGEERQKREHGGKSRQVAMSNVP